MKLYYVPGVCSLSPHIALRESGLKFDLDRVDLSKGKRTDAGVDYVALNPKGYVPALQLDDGQVITEGAVIVQYIADQKPESKLAPPNGTMERIRLQEWLHFIATELHKGMSILYNPKASDEVKQMGKDRLKARFDILAKGLQGKTWLMGDTFTVVDGYAFYCLRAWQKMANVELREFPVLADYYKRIAERPSVRAALEAEGLTP